MWDRERDSHTPEQMSTDDLAACYGLAGQLRKHEPEARLDIALRLWMFTARMELEARGKLELIRDWLPVYFDPTKRVPVFGPGAALAAPTGDDQDGKGIAAVRTLRQIAG